MTLVSFPLMTQQQCMHNGRLRLLFYTTHTNNPSHRHDVFRPLLFLLLIFLVVLFLLPLPSPPLPLLLPTPLPLPVQPLPLCHLYFDEAPDPAVGGRDVRRPPVRGVVPLCKPLDGMRLRMGLNEARLVSSHKTHHPLLPARLRRVQVLDDIERRDQVHPLPAARGPAAGAISRVLRRQLVPERAERLRDGQLLVAIGEQPSAELLPGYVCLKMGLGLGKRCVFGRFIHAQDVRTHKHTHALELQGQDNDAGIRLESQEQAEVVKERRGSLALVAPRLAQQSNLINVHVSIDVRDRKHHPFIPFTTDRQTIIRTAQCGSAGSGPAMLECAAPGPGARGCV